MDKEKSVVSQRFMPTYYAIAIATHMGDVKKKGKFRFPIYLSDSLYEVDIEHLELSVRSNNCLRRAGYQTIGDLVNSINCEDDLKKIRQCGTSSSSEIMNSLMCYQYEKLSPERRKKYIDRINELNKRSLMD